MGCLGRAALWRSEGFSPIEAFSPARVVDGEYRRRDDRSGAKPKKANQTHPG